MTQFHADADNGDNTHSGLEINQTATIVITSSDAGTDQVLTAAAHNLATADKVNIVGHTGSTPDINGANQQITVVDTTHFTIDGVDITVGGTGGTMQEEDGPFADIHQFSENTRSAGDILRCRRGTTARYDDGGELAFTSDGTFGNPIIVEADFDNLWVDDVTADQTYTMVFGSKVHTASATITTLAAGKYIYVVGDDQREFAYEVASVATDQLTLKLPFKGSTGAGKSLTVMKANPVWGATSGHAFRWSFSGDQYWKTQGIDPKSSITSRAIDLSSSSIILVKDCHVEVSNSAAKCFRGSGGTFAFVKKTRTTAVDESFELSGFMTVILEDVLTEGESSTSVDRAGTSYLQAKDCEFGKKIVALFASNATCFTFLRNCILPAIEFSGTGAEAFIFINSQDHDGVVGKSYLFKSSQQTTTDPLVVEETTTIRPGGSNTSQKIAPSAGSAFSTAWELSREVLLEIPIFAGTENKKYKIFMRPDLTASWTVDPTAAELYLEGEFWGHPTNNFRRITRSTGVIDMNGSTAWQSLEIDVQPSQQGLGFLRIVYAKPKEGGVTNVFFIDPKEVIT